MRLTASAVGFTNGLPGACKQAPVALLRVGHGCELFAQFARHREWEAVLGFAQ